MTAKDKPGQDSGKRPLATPTARRPRRKLTGALKASGAPADSAYTIAVFQRRGELHRHLPTILGP
jgi:hypothetical protein